MRRLNLNLLEIIERGGGEGYVLFAFFICPVARVAVDFVEEGSRRAA